MSEELLSAINAKLTAILAIEVDKHLRSTTGTARPREQSIEEILYRSGLGTSEIATLLGKTRRAVNLSLQGRVTRPRRKQA